ncbi:MAG TPA: hypothetical protein VIY90_20245 [Steroidobacteraceae bacterium]
MGARPSLRVGWLKWRNAARRWPLAASVLLLAFIGLGALGRMEVAQRALATLASAPLVIFTITAVILTAIILRRRRRLTSARHRDWLAALPHDLSLTARAAVAPLPLWGGAILIIAVAAIAANLGFSASISLLVAAAGGYLAAIAVVTLVRIVEAKTQTRRRSRQAIGRRRYESPPSHYAVVLRGRSDWATNAGLLPLGYWPVAQTKFWDRPKLRARSLVLMLLAVPLDVAGGVVLVAACAWLLTLHLVNLLLGVIRVAFTASWWLAPTPIGTVRFTAAVSHRALAGQVATCALLAGAAYAIKGAPALHTGVLFAVGWLGAVCLVSATACAIALRTRSTARSVLHRWMR